MEQIATVIAIAALLAAYVKFSRWFADWSGGSANHHYRYVVMDTPTTPIQDAAIRDAWEQCKQHGLNEETIHFMDNALDGAGY